MEGKHFVCFPSYISKRRINEKTTFEITKMDCPSEENLIRMKLDGITEVKHLEFDIPNRKLSVMHTGQLTEIKRSLMDLNLGIKRLQTEQSNQTVFKEHSNQ
jgi:cation transport ATPase